MAYINGREILFSTSITEVKEEGITVETLEDIKKSIITKGGNVSRNATIDDIPSAILGIPVGDTNYVKVIDSEDAYEKHILSGAVDYAMINKISGWSFDKAQTSKNILNPKLLTIGTQNYDYTDAYGAIEPVFNDDGSITFVDQLRYEDEYTIIQGLISALGCSYGRYFIYLEGTSNPSLEECNEYGYFCIKCNNTDNIGTHTIKVMLWQDTSVTLLDSYEIVEAPEGTEFEPFIENIKKYRVSRIESHGANILVFPYGKQKQYGEGYSETINGVTYTVLPYGGIHKKGTATDYSQFVLVSDSAAPKLIPGECYQYSGISSISYSFTDYNGNTRTAYWYGSVLTWNEDFKIKNINIIVRKGETVDEIVYPMLHMGIEKMPYKQYKGIIDTRIISPSVGSLTGCDREGSTIEWHNGEVYLKVTKDENLEDLSEPKVSVITAYFSSDELYNLLKIEEGGFIRFVNEGNRAIQNEITYIRSIQ